MNREEAFITMLEDRLEQGDERYIPSWQEEADIWQELGIYREISKIVDPQTNEIHVDLGSGLGNLLCEIKKRCWQTALVGVEARSNMIKRAFDNVVRGMIPVSTYTNTEYVLTPQQTIQRVHAFDSELISAEEVVTPSDTIHLLCDDIRQATVLRSVLGDTKIDSGSFTFAGGFEGLVLLDPYIPIPRDVEDIMNRSYAIQMDVRRKAMAILAEYVREGGRVVLAERFIGDNIPAEEIAKNVAGALGDMNKYFSGLDIFTLENPIQHHGGDIGWRNKGYVVNGPVDQPANVFVAKLTRNAREFEIGK